MELSAAELIKKMQKRESLGRVIAVCGEEEYFRSRIAALLPEYVFASAQEEDREITVFDKDTDLKQLESVINSYPFFCGQSLVVIRDEKLLGGKQDSEAKKKQTENLLKLLADVPEYCTVFVNAGKLDKRGKLYKALKKNAVFCECVSIKPENLSPWLKEQAQAYGGSFDYEAIQTIMEYLAPVDAAPLQLLQQEIAKLAVYAGERKVWTKADVEVIFSSLPEVSHFALLNAIADKRLRETLELLADERKKGTEILLLCARIMFQVRRLGCVQEMLDNGYSQSKIALEMGFKSSFPVKIMSGQCRRFPGDVLKNAFLELAQLNIDLRRGGRRFDRLEEILVKLLYS